jgi:hypothetical protein
MLQIVPNYNEMFYRCFTKENDGVKHLAILGLETRKI